MLNKLNNFLNAFEKIFKRFLVVCLATFAFPFIMLAFILGLIGLEKIETKDDED
jgi:hypothetical protein